MFRKAKEFILKYERYVSPITLVLGFIFDSLMLRRIDVLFSNALLISYLLISAICILALNVSESRRTDHTKETTFHLVLIFMMQFCFGGLFSASFLFYSRSGSIATSWPFLLLILGYMIGNEFFRKNYTRLGFQISAFFSALFSYLIFFLPIVLGQMDDSIFLLSGISTLVITGLFIYVLSWFAAVRVKRSFPMTLASVASIFAIINILYFTNLIPPIPLAFRESGIYQSITSFPDGSYLLTGEERGFFDKVLGRNLVHIAPGDPVYAWTAIFAPTNFKTNVLHVWQYFDEETKQWTTSNKVYLSIEGGRDNGFRTYSIKENVFPGKWRVNAETPRGQVIGRLVFEIANSTGSEKVVKSVK